MTVNYTKILSTYSIVAYDEDSNQLGVAVQTHQVGVGRMVPFLLPGVGAIATQSLVNVGFGSMALTMLAEGVSAPDVVAGLIASDPERNRRQLAVVDASGKAGAYTGDGCIPHADHYTGKGYSVQANMMTNDTVIPAMREAYEKSKEDLAGRMMAALYAAQAEDGDIRGMQSAALHIVQNDRSLPSWSSLYNLRIDESATPLDDLYRLVIFQRAQNISGEGYDLLEKGNVQAALIKWRQARELAPENEEMAFWQAVALADRNPTNNAVDIAARIIQMALSEDDRYDHWIELIQRLEQVGLIEREGAARELLVELNRM